MINFEIMADNIIKARKEPNINSCHSYQYIMKMLVNPQSRNAIISCLEDYFFNETTSKSNKLLIMYNDLLEEAHLSYPLEETEDLFLDREKFTVEKIYRKGNDVFKVHYIERERQNLPEICNNIFNTLDKRLDEGLYIRLFSVNIDNSTIDLVISKKTKNKYSCS